MDRQELKDRTFLVLAIELGQLGTCSRGQVGAIITKDGRCVSWGYNGAPPGAPHCEDNEHGWAGMAEPWMEGCRNSIHAEANAVSFAARQGISTDNGTLYVECAPCLNCAQLLLAAGIERVCYNRTYRDDSGLSLLTTAGVDVVLISP